MCGRLLGAGQRLGRGEQLPGRQEATQDTREGVLSSRWSLWVTGRATGLLSSSVVKSEGSGVRRPGFESPLRLLAAGEPDLGPITEPWYLLREVSWGLNGITNLNHFAQTLAQTLTYNKLLCGESAGRDENHSCLPSDLLCTQRAKLLGGSVLLCSLELET